MPATIALLVVYIVLMAFFSILVADVVFVYSYKPERYVTAKLELEEAIEEYRALRKQALDKRIERRLKKLIGKINEKRRIVTRASLYRLLIILPLYFASAISVASMGHFFPSPCCIPLLTVSVKNACLVLPSMLLLIAYIMFIPLIQDSLLSLILAKRRLEKQAIRQK